MKKQCYARSSKGRNTAPQNNNRRNQKGKSQQRLWPSSFMHRCHCRWVRPAFLAPSCFECETASAQTPRLQKTKKQEKKKERKKVSLCAVVFLLLLLLLLLLIPGAKYKDKERANAARVPPC
jgi:hypothetical protein